MIILSETNEPSEGVRLSQPQVVAYLDGECAGEGKLQVTWICRSSGLGFSLTYPSIILHAVSTDLSSFPHECIYVLVDASKSAKSSACFRYSYFSVQQIYEEMCSCQELNPDENDDFSDEDGGGDMIVDESVGSGGAEWYTAENVSFLPKLQRGLYWRKVVRGFLVRLPQVAPISVVD
ncbi:unnamed protein product [Haemonchus placei]|uniref:Methylosome subunit pICln n=1 Tax=Haemonchus placei TaxID=6290 RepID=A0A0N4VST4_HAEPC|nr:unnamed protein product [Haemonchus placei]